MKNRRLFFSVVAVGAITSHLLMAQATAPTTTPAPPAHKSKSAAAAKAAPITSVWTPDVQQFLGVSQGSFSLVGLNKLSKAQVEALVNAAKNSVSGDSKRYLLACGPTTPGQSGRTRVWVTVSGDDPQGLRLAEIRTAIRGLSNVDVVDAAASADRALHIVIQEQSLGKRIIGYTASYMTSTPCVDESRKTDAELKGQLGTYTDPKGVDLARDLAGMLDQDLQGIQSGK